MSFEAWKEGHVTTSEWHVPVVAPPPGMKREAVSSRLRQTLVHPDKSGVLVGLGYSSDGHRIVAGHTNSGIVQFWDTVSGRQLNRIETWPAKIIGFREYFLLSPDMGTLYFNRGSVGGRIIKGKEKRVIHYEVNSGSVRAWDVETGKPRYDLPISTDRGAVFLELSPDGSTLLARGVVSGDYDPTNVKWFVTLWNARTGQRRGELPENDYPGVHFSPDGASLLTTTFKDEAKTAALLFLDAASGKVRRSIPIEPRPRIAYFPTLSPDGKQVACCVEAATGENRVKYWDVASGREIASFEGQIKGRFLQPVFSPDGRMIALPHWLRQRKLYLFDTERKQLIKIVPLAEEHWPRHPVFSPDGKWIAILSQYNPTNQSIYRVNPDMLPQPRILLIESSTGEVRETIIAPPAVAVSLCFSPDGKTLASGGEGRVLLWDMTKPPGTRSAAR